jgi:hypothetical protein
VDPRTGVPVDDDGNWLVAGQHRYVCFPSAEAAEGHARERLRRDPDVEWGLFDSRGARVNVLRDPDALRRAAPRPWRRFWRRLFDGCG